MSQEKRAVGGQPGNQNGRTHGLYRFKRLLSGDGLDRRTSLFKALAEKEREFVVALGGDPSPQERVLIGDSVKTMLYIGSLDRYLSGLKSLVRKGKVHAVLPERTRLAAHLRENLRALGLQRREREVVDLARAIQEEQRQAERTQRQEQAAEQGGDDGAQG